MISSRASGLFRRSFILAFLLFLPGPLWAQIAPGVPRRDYWGVERARFRREMLGEVNERLDRWCSAWEADDVEELADHYAENALVLLTDEEIWGPEAIQTALEESLPEAGPIAHELVDFEVSGSLAYVLGRFRYTETNEETGARVRRGRLLTILDKQSGNWKIRSQVFSEESPD